MLQSLAEKQISKNDHTTSSCKNVLLVSDKSAFVSFSLLPTPHPLGRSTGSVKVIAPKREQMGLGLRTLHFLIFSPPSTFHTHLFEKLKATHRCKELFSSAWLQPRPSVPMAAGALGSHSSRCALSGSLSGSPNWAVNGSRAGPRPSFLHPGHLAQHLARRRCSVAGGWVDACVERQSQSREVGRAPGRRNLGA